MVYLILFVVVNQWKINYFYKNNVNNSNKFFNISKIAINI